MSPRVRRYIRLAAATYGTTPRQILGECRDNLNARARWAVMARLRDDGFSYPQIGRWMRRHHSSVLHGVQHRCARAEAMAA